MWRTALCLALALAVAPARASAEDLCSGHRMLAAPRAETSCLERRPEIVASPDGALRAVIYPADIDLYGTPDLESRVVIRDADGRVRKSADYSSERGTTGDYVVNGRWSPDSRYFVFSLASSGGHSPWSFPIRVYSRAVNEIGSVNLALGDRATVSPEFEISAPHALSVTAQEIPGSQRGVAVSLDLDKAVPAPNK